MTTQQIILSLVLATMVFSVALELQLDDFLRVARSPKAVIVGLIPQFILLPVATWAATLVLDLPPNVEAAMILVATPAGAASLTNSIRVNTAAVTTTITTVGYGDISSTNSTEKGVTILYQIIGVIFFSLISSFLASII
jgi:predicted Na+-dependent transporter